MMPPVPYCAEKVESLVFTSPITSKIGVLITLLLIGELMFAPSSIAVENGMLPFAATPPMPGFEELFPFCCTPDVPGSNTRNDCQSGVPVWQSFLVLLPGTTARLEPQTGKVCSVSIGSVADSS